MIALGHDPGLSSPGLSLLARSTRGVWSCLRSPILHSLDEYLAELADIQSTIKVDVFGIEDVHFSFAKAAENPEAKGARHGKGSARILESVGATRLAAKMAGAPVHMFQPAHWRKTLTGSPRNTPHNEQVLQLVLSKRIQGWPPRTSSHRRASAALAIMAGTLHSQANLLPQT